MKTPIKKKRPVTRIKISVSLSPDNYQKLFDLNINKSKFINWLLEDHFNLK